MFNIVTKLLSFNFEVCFFYILDPRTVNKTDDDDIYNLDSSSLKGIYFFDKIWGKKIQNCFLFEFLDYQVFSFCH
jgi:hypothetical protein